MTLRVKRDSCKNLAYSWHIVFGMNDGDGNDDSSLDLKR
jgi:hypothetical protein